jgi:hypothetical protein
LSEEGKAWLSAFLEAELGRRGREVEILQQQLAEEAAAMALEVWQEEQAEKAIKRESSTVASLTSKAWLVAFLQAEVLRRESEIGILRRELAEEQQAIAGAKRELSRAASRESGLSTCSDVANSEDYRVVAGALVSTCVLPFEPEHCSTSAASSPMLTNR